MYAVVPNRVEDLGGSVGLDVIARSHHNKPDGSEENTEEISLRPAKNIQDLGEGEIGDTADNTAQNADGGRERVLREGRGDIGSKSSRGARQHTLDEVGEPDHDIGEDQGGGRPCHGHGLDVLDTWLGMDVYDGLVAVRVRARVHGIVQVVDVVGLLLVTSVGLRRHGLLPEREEQSCFEGG